MPEKIDVKKDKTKKDETTEIAVRKENPFSLFQRFDRMFDDMRRGFENWLVPSPYDQYLSTRGDRFRTPLSNIEETDKEYRIQAELPGIDKNEVSVTLDEGKLEIKADHKRETEEKDENLIRREYRSSSFYRCFTVPENVNHEKIEASFDKGMLTLNLPKMAKKEKDKKTIEIK